jgi:RNA polymerase sigma-70 factor (ECF subfamily)
VGADPFATVYGAEHGKLVAALTVATGDPGVAADAVDEAFVRAYERWHRVGEMASPVGWIYRTALNVVRRRARRRAVEEQLLRRRPATDIGPPPDWSPEVWDALQRLPVRERTAMALRYVADLTTEEIASAMRIAPGTVGSTLHSARRRLAALMEEEADA